MNSFQYYPYDPAFPEYGPPKEADLVCCIDVLEHIEEIFLDNVLNDLKKITKKLGFFTIHTGPAVKILEDGRNAHLIQKTPSWWLPKMCSKFEIKHLQEIVCLRYKQLVSLTRTVAQWIYQNGCLVAYGYILCNCLLLPPGHFFRIAVRGHRLLADFPCGSGRYRSRWRY